MKEESQRSQYGDYRKNKLEKTDLKKKKACGRFVNGHNSTYLWMYRKTQCT